MKIVQMKTGKLLLVVSVWAAAFFGLSFFDLNNWQALNLVGFPFLIIAPGLLTVIAMKLEDLEFWGLAGIIIGISVLELMLMALIGNWLLPLFGVARPLDKIYLLGELFVVVAALAFFCRSRKKEISITVGRFWLFDNAADLIMVLAAAIFPLLAVLGAISINNGGSNGLTLAMLAGIVVYSIVLVKRNGKSGANVVPMALFFISLALLLMTSLRGWYVTGHDIQREYQFFELAKNDGIWSAATYEDAYNACLSITILPAVFSNLLRVFDPYVYKILFQVIFAAVPGIVYLIARRYLIAPIAVVAAFCFVVFPTFYADMPFLNRQEIAFLFFALMIYAIFESRLAGAARRFLFLFFGLGLIVSHYSTTYAAIAIFLFLVFTYPIMRLVAPDLGKMKLFAESGVAGFKDGTKLVSPTITMWLVLPIILGTFLWTGATTKTASNNILDVIGQTILAMKSNATEESKSSDVSFSFFSIKASQIGPELLKDYQENVVAAALAWENQGGFYDASEFNKYPIAAVDIQTMPLTPAGKALAAADIDISSVSYFLHQLFARFLQMLVIAGFLFVLFKSRFLAKPIDGEFVLMSAGSIALLAAFVLLPTISADYGVFRAFQQMLVFLGVFMAIGIMIPSAKFRKTGMVLAAAFLLIFFFLETGAVTAVFGGYNPKLNLDNAGLYYDIYYVHAGEIAGSNWLAGQIEKSGDLTARVQADYFMSIVFAQSGFPKDIFSQNSIYPPLVEKDAYVILGFTNTTKQTSTVFYKGSLFTYTYPVQFLADSKDLIYSNGQTQIYR